MNYDERIIAESKRRYALQTERDAFLDGVQYCEENPAWRMCKDELPDKPCECVCHDGECMFFAEWVDDTKQGGLSGWSINGVTAQPIAWLPLPVFNPKQETK